MLTLKYYTCFQDLIDKIYIFISVLSILSFACKPYKLKYELIFNQCFTLYFYTFIAKICSLHLIH